MPGRRVFDKIQSYLNRIDTNKDCNITQKELKKAANSKQIPSIWLNNIENIMNNKDMSRDNIIMALGVVHAEESDEEHIPDKDSDGGIFRFKRNNDEENYKSALANVKFFIERSVEKWFSLDINIDGKSSSVEDHRWKRHDNVSDMNDGDLNESEYAKKYNLKIKKGYDNYQRWIKSWKEYEIYLAAYDFGVILREEDLKELDEYAKIQINAKLVKSGQDKTASLYNRLGNDAYTRLVTRNSTDSCCGGSVVPPPMTSRNNGCALVFGEMNYSQKYLESLPESEEPNPDKVKNSSEEVRNRLAWAIFKTPEPEKLYNPETDKYEWSVISQEEYTQWYEKWVTVREMEAKDFRALLNDKEKCAEFEKDSNMSVQQIVDYIDIVESVTGKDFDSDDWSVNIKQFYEIAERINGTYGDEKVLDGKTKADILPERKNLYEYLKKNNLLLQQFMD